MGGIFGKLFGKKTETHEMSILSNISVGQKTPKSVVTVQGRRSKKRVKKTVGSSKKKKK